MTVTEFDAGAVDRRIGTNLKMLVKARERTIKEVAGRVGLSYSAINERLVGKRHFLAAEVDAFAKELGVDVGELYREPLSRFISRSESAWNRTGAGHGPRRPGRDSTRRPVTVRYLADLCSSP